MACNEKEWQIVDLLATTTLMFMIEEQGKHSCNVLMSFSFDFLFLLFVFNALFLVLLCLLLVASLKLSHVLLFSSLYFWCIVLVILAFLLVVKPTSRVWSTSSLMFWCLLFVIKLVSWYLVFHQFHFWYSHVFFWSSG